MSFFIHLFNKNIYKSKFTLGFVLFLKKNKIKFFFNNLKKKIINRFFFFKFFIRGYSFKVKNFLRRRFMRLDLGYPLPWFVKLPKNLFVLKRKKRAFIVLSKDYMLLSSFCRMLENIRNKSLPYRIKGLTFLYSRRYVVRKIGKRSKR